jgi:hypothetical protein
LFPAPIRKNRQYLPLLVPMFLQLTFRVFKVKPSDAELFATIVPLEIAGKWN